MFYFHCTYYVNAPFISIHLSSRPIHFVFKNKCVERVDGVGDGEDDGVSPGRGKQTGSGQGTVRGELLRLQAGKT